jgi:hypothetical protein
VRGKGTSKFDRMVWGCLASHIYENPVETEVDLIGRISSVCVNFQKYAMYICVCMQWSLCVASSITMMSQPASLTALLNYSKILPLKYTTLSSFEKYIYNDMKKFKMLNRLVYFKYLMLRGLWNPCCTYNYLEFTSDRNFKLCFTSSTTLRS